MQVLVEGDETKNRVCVVYVWFLAFLYIYICVFIQHVLGQKNQLKVVKVRNWHDH